jgi:hypothetical protein
MLPILLVILTFGALYWFPIRRWMNQWGATPSDLARVMAGDSFLADPTYSGTITVTVNAPPEYIWPWWVQIGYQRGGLYGYDWLDRLFGYLDRPSATRVLPEFQRLAVGDAIPLVEAHAGRWPSLSPIAPSCWICRTWAALIGCGSSVCTRLTRRGLNLSRAAASVPCSG